MATWVVAASTLLPNPCVTLTNKKLERTAPLDIVNKPVIGIELAGASKKSRNAHAGAKKIAIYEVC
jgi:hypothetical protein